MSIELVEMNVIESNQRDLENYFIYFRDKNFKYRLGISDKEGDLELNGVIFDEDKNIIDNTGEFKEKPLLSLEFLEHDFFLIHNLPEYQTKIINKMKELKNNICSLPFSSVKVSSSLIMFAQVDGSNGRWRCFLLLKDELEETKISQEVKIFLDKIDGFLGEENIPVNEDIPPNDDELDLLFEAQTELDKPEKYKYTEFFNVKSKEFREYMKSIFKNNSIKEYFELKKKYRDWKINNSGQKSFYEVGKKYSFDVRGKLDGYHSEIKQKSDGQHSENNELKVDIYTFENAKNIFRIGI